MKGRGLAFFRAALICGLAALGAGNGRAQEGADPFALVAPSIARLNFSGFRTMGHCTVAQAGVRAALVSGDCVKVGSFDQLHLLFGYDRQAWTAHRVGKAAFNDPARADLKLLCLSENLPAPRFGLGSEPVFEGDRVVVGGYAMPAPHKATFTGCGVARVQDASGFVLGCDLAAGSVGAPVFKLGEGKARLLGVVARSSTDAALVLRWTGESPDRLCPPYPATTASDTNG